MIIIIIIIKPFNKTEVQDQLASQVNSTKHLEKSLCLSFSKSFKKLQRNSERGIQTDSKNILKGSYIKGSYTMIYMGFIPGMQGWFIMCQSM